MDFEFQLKPIAAIFPDFSTPLADECRRRVRQLELLVPSQKGVQQGIHF